MVEKNKVQRFCFFDAIDFFEFFRRTLSLISPSVMVIFMLSLAAFFIEDKDGSNSFKYQLLMASIVVFIGFIAFAVLFDLNKNYEGVNLSYLAKLFVFIVTLFLCGGIVYVGVINAASMYALIKAN
ncbi:hypothetical protein ACK2MR_22350 [Providencia hangzhouensis]|uniref:hypothetical protein n=1 Tax=Providencia hangzhouensis TaxID=3031799 RepID=UPI003F1CEF01